MINIKKYSFRKYSKVFPKIFTLEKQKLRKIFPKENIEHIGSSSVKGLGGKGIVDIAIAVPKYQIKKSINKLQEIGYNYRTSGGNKERKFLQKIIKYNGIERRIHVQLISKNSNAWNSVIAVRNYLRKNKKITQEYAKLKKEAVKYAKGESKKYREFKESFLEKLEKVALKKYRKIN